MECKNSFGRFQRTPLSHHKAVLYSFQKKSLSLVNCLMWRSKVNNWRSSKKWRPPPPKKNPINIVFCLNQNYSHLILYWFSNNTHSDIVADVAHVDLLKFCVPKINTAFVLCFVSISFFLFFRPLLYIYLHVHLYFVYIIKFVFHVPVYTFLYERFFI